MQVYPRPEAKRRQVRLDTASPARVPAYHRPYASLDLQRGSPSSYNQSLQLSNLRPRPDPYHHHPLVSTERLPLIQPFPPPWRSMDSSDLPQATRPSIREDIAHLGLDRAVAPLHVPLAGSPIKKKRRPTPLRPTSLSSTPSLSPNPRSPLSSPSALSATSPVSHQSTISSIASTSLPSAPLASPRFVEFGAISGDGPLSHMSAKRPSSRGGGRWAISENTSRPQSPALQVSVRATDRHGDSPAFNPLPSSRRQSSPLSASRNPNKQMSSNFPKFKATSAFRNFFSCSNSESNGRTERKRKETSSSKGEDQHATVVAIDGSTQTPDMQVAIPKLRQLKMPKTKQR